MKKGLCLAAGWLVALALFITGCNGQSKESLEPTATEVQNTILGVSVSNLSITCPPAVPPEMQYKTARMHFTFAVRNPDENETVTLDKFEFVVYGDEYTVAGPDTMVRGESLNLTIEPAGDVELSFPLPYIVKDDYPALWSEMIKGKVTWRIEGTAYIRTPAESLSVPFQCIIGDYSLNMNEHCLEGE
jgi:hypothetical protein